MQNLFHFRRAALLAAAASLCLAGGVQAAAAPSPSSSPAFDRDIAASKQAMMTDPRVALERARQAEAEAGRAAPSGEQQIDAATSAWLEAEAMFRMDQAAPALPIVDRALAQILRTQPESKLAGDLVLVHGKLSAAVGRVQDALTDFQKAYRIYGKAGVPRSQAIALQQIGSLYEDARDYPHVLQYYRQSAEAYSADANLALAAHNNLGEAYKHMGRFTQAEAEYRQALAIAGPMQSPLLQAHFLDNIASAQIGEGRLDAAAATVKQAMAAAASPEAAEERPFLLGQSGVIAWKRGHLQEAAALIDRAFAGTDLNATSPSYLDFHKAGYEVYSRLGDSARALAHLKAAKRLEDAERDLAASTNAALMSAQFDFANQDLKIARLKADELQKAAQARLTITLIVGFAGLAFLGLVTTGFFQMRKSRNQVRAANTQLSQTNTALEKALRAKTDFLATTSHEIRTPLNGILGMTEVLLTDAAIPGPSRERVKLVHASGQAMRAMVDDLLDVAKNEKGEMDVVREAFDLQGLLKDIAATWADQAAARGLAFVSDFAEAPARVVDDRHRLRQLLSNLVSNAIKFTEQGQVVLRARGAADRLILEIADTGVGIAEEDQERIFESFTQVDSSTVRRYSGTGLGLAICRNIAAALGGTVTVRSNLGHGSTFTVDLPLTAAEAEASTTADAARALDEASVLVIQGNPMAQAMVRAVLQPEVRSLEVVATLEEAQAACAAQAFDRILVDGPSILQDEASVPATVAALAALPTGSSVLVLADPKNEAALSALQGEPRLQVLLKPVAKPALVEALGRFEAPDADPERAVA